MSTITNSKHSGAASSRACSGESVCAEVKPDLIRRRAYEIFQARNGGPGDQTSDWAQAERELSGAGHDARAAVRPANADAGSFRGQPAAGSR